MGAEGPNPGRQRRAALGATRPRPTRRVVPGWGTASVGLVVLAVAIAAIVFTGGRGAADSHSRPTPASARAGAVGVPAVETGLLPWRFQAPISREVLLAQPGGASLLVAGGIGADGSSAAGAFRLDPRTGDVSLVGSLSSATHDAAATLLGGRGLILGGGTSLPSSVAQDLTPGGLLTQSDCSRGRGPTRPR